MAPTKSLILTAIIIGLVNTFMMWAADFSNISILIYATLLTAVVLPIVSLLNGFLVALVLNKQNDFKTRYWRGFAISLVIVNVLVSLTVIVDILK